MNKVDDDPDIVGQEVFAQLNDGLEIDLKKDMLVIDFPLQIRLVHKVIVECLLLRIESSTSISTKEVLIILALKENKKIDIAEMVIRQLMKCWKIKPHAGVIMKLLKFKKVRIPKKNTHLDPHKIISESNFHKMGIYIKDNLWYALDNSMYMHLSCRKKVNWNVQKKSIERDLFKKTC